MKQLPKNILVVGIIRYFDNDEIVNILKEYFNGVPHIDITEYKFNKQSIYYIIQDTYAMRRFIHKIFCMEPEDKLLDYSVYVISNTTEYTYAQRVYFKRLPRLITFDATNVKKLLLLESV